MPELPEAVVMLIKEEVELYKKSKGTKSEYSILSELQGMLKISGLITPESPEQIQNLWEQLLIS
jgi:hypothetical protein